MDVDEHRYQVHLQAFVNDFIGRRHLSDTLDDLIGHGEESIDGRGAVDDQKVEDRT